MTAFKGFTVQTDWPRKPLHVALTEARQFAEEHLNHILTRHNRTGPIADAMRYASTGGKGLRAFLAMEGARLHGISPKSAAHPAAAIECVHAYSLIHDDLPCMDDDDLRRGHPTVHRKWDEATAVLAGDALQAMAFQILAESRFRPERIVGLMQSLGEAAGVGGMVGGQALDMAAETAAEPLTLDEITILQAGKTGALIKWAALVGPRVQEADTGPMRDYAQALGLAFQIADDILDVEGDAQTVGKAVGKDADAGKATFVSHLGLDGAKRRAQELVQSACDALHVYGDDADTLRDCAQYVITRKN